MSIYQNYNNLVFNLLKSDYFGILILKILSIIIALLLNIAIAHVLGPTNTGVYFLGLSIMLFFNLVGRLGLENSIVKNISGKIALKKYKDVKIIQKLTLKYSIIGLCIFSLILLLLSKVISIYVFKEPDLEFVLLFFSLAIIPSGISILIAQMFQGMQKFKTFIIINEIFLPFFLLIIIILFFHFLNLNLFIIFYFLGSLCLLFLSLFFLIKNGSFSFRIKYDISEKLKLKSELLKPTKSLLLISFLSLLWSNADIIFLGIWKSSYEVGIYSIGKKIINLLNIFVLGFIIIASPKFSSYFQKQDYLRLKNVFIRFSLGIFLLTSFFGVFFLLNASLILSIFGQGFNYNPEFLEILILGQIAISSLGLSNPFFIMIDKEKVIRNYNILITIIFLIFLSFFIPHYGIIGASISYMITFSFGNCYLFYKTNVFLNEKVKLQVIQPINF